MAEDRRTERHRATRREILGAAWDLAGEHGLAGWSLRDLAVRVGMRAPSLYGYFDSKHAVFDALFAEGCAALLDRIDAALADLEERQAGPAEALDVAAELFFAFCVEDPPRHQLLFLRTLPGFEPSPDAYALAVQALDRLAMVLAAAGAGSREQVDLWTALFTGLATQQVTNDPGGDRWHRLLGPATAMFRAATPAGPRSPGAAPEAAPTIRP